MERGKRRVGRRGPGSYGKAGGVPGLEVRFDKSFPAASWLKLYRIAHYNDWWTDRNAGAARAYAHLIVAAWEDGELIGTLSVWSDGVDFAWLDDVVVHPLRRGAGIVSQLVRAALDRLSGHIEVIQVLPIPGSERFYERLGFVIQPGATVMDFRHRIG